MKNLTKTQIEHTMQRLRGIACKHLNDLRDRLTQSERKLTDDEILDALKEGDFLIRLNREASDYRSGIRAFLEFPHESPRMFDDSTYEKAHDAVYAKVDAIHDKLVLAQPQDALDIIDNFDDVVTGTIKKETGNK